MWYNEIEIISCFYICTLVNYSRLRGLEIIFFVGLFLSVILLLCIMDHTGDGVKCYAKIVSPAWFTPFLV